MKRLGKRSTENQVKGYGDSNRYQEIMNVCQNEGWL